MGINKKERILMAAHWGGGHGTAAEVVVAAAEAHVVTGIASSGDTAIGSKLGETVTINNIDVSPTGKAGREASPPRGKRRRRRELSSSLVESESSVLPPRKRGTGIATHNNDSDRSAAGGEFEPCASTMTTTTASAEKVPVVNTCLVPDDCCQGACRQHLPGGSGSSTYNNGDAERIIMSKEGSTRRNPSQEEENQGMDKHMLGAGNVDKLLGSLHHLQHQETVEAAQTLKVCEALAYYY